MSELGVRVDGREIPALNGGGANLSLAMYDLLVPMLKPGGICALFNVADVNEVQIFHSEQAIRDFFNGRR